MRVGDPRARLWQRMGRHGRAARAQRMEVLRRAVRGRPRARGRVVGRCSCCAACCRRCSRSRWARWSARCSAASRLAAAARGRRRRVRAAAGARAAPPGGRREPRQPHRGLALRPAHRAPACARRAWATSRTPSSPATSRWRATSTSASPGRRCRSRWTSSPRGLVEMIGGLASARRAVRRTRGGRRCCSAGAWLATHWLLRESGVWRDRNTDEVREAQRHADYAYRLAVDPPAAKELRLFGLGGLDDRALRGAAPAPVRAAVARDAAARAAGAVEPAARARRERRRVLVAGRRGGRRAARARSRWSSFAHGRGGHEHDRVRRAVVGARRRRGAGRRGAAPASDAMAPAGALRRAATRAADGAAGARDPLSRRHVRAIPAAGAPVLEGFDLTIPAGSSLAIVGQNGAGKTTLAKLLCRLYDPQAGAIEVDGVDLRELDLDGWRARVTAVFQDFIRFELPLRDNVAPAGAPDDVDPRGARARRARRSSPSSTRSSRAATRAAPTCRAASGSASRWRARCARCGSAPGSCCSTSRPRSSTCAARPRSSTASSPPRATPPRS